MSKAHPTAAPAHFPYRDHRTMEQVAREEYLAAIDGIIGNLKHRLSK